MKKHCVIGEEVLTALLRKRVGMMKRNVKPAREHDVDGIHDLRVASRRVRSALKEGRIVFGKKALDAFNERIRSVTQLLGTARELDVSIALLEELRPRFRGPRRRAATQALRRMRDLREMASVEVETAAETVSAEEFRSSYNALLASHAPPKKCYLSRVEEAAGKHLQTLQAAYLQWRETESEEDLHQVRIRFKKMRYTCEAYQDTYGAPMKTFIKELKAAQQALGRWNDLRVLRNYVWDARAGAPEDTVAGFEPLHDALQERIHGLLKTVHENFAAFFTEDRTDRLVSILSKPEKRCETCPHSPPQGS